MSDGWASSPLMADRVGFRGAARPDTRYRVVQLQPGGVAGERGVYTHGSLCDFCRLAGVGQVAAEQAALAAAEQKAQAQRTWSGLPARAVFPGDGKWHCPICDEAGRQAIPSQCPGCDARLWSDTKLLPLGAS
jgi:hypothetical protein